MSKDPQKMLALIFIVITLASTVATIYSFNYYFGVYTSLRALTTSISDFDVQILAINAHVETILVLDNPSFHGFHVIGVEQRVYVNGEFFTYTRPSTPSIRYPMWISPYTSLNITIDADRSLSPDLVELLQQAAHRDWFTTIFVRLEGPIVGRFWMSTEGSF